MRISGSVAPDTHSLPTNGGARFGAPVPVSWWQGAQYIANTSRPLATRCNSAGGSGVSRGVAASTPAPGHVNNSTSRTARSRIAGSAPRASLIRLEGSRASVMGWLRRLLLRPYALAASKAAACCQ